MELEHSEKLINFINKSTCSFLAVKNIKERLLSQGFIELFENQKWDLELNGKYFFIKNNSSVISFIIGSEIIENGFKIIASHLDSPSFVLKPNCEMKFMDRYLTLNTEGYGGMLPYSWLDRPLSISGRVILRSKNIFKPKEKIIDFKRPLLIIPSLAIHLSNKDIKEAKFNKQEHMIPILSLIDENFEEKEFIKKVIAEEIKVSKDEILDYELFLYEYEKGSIIGLNKEFISSSRLDDLMMVFNSLESFIKQSNEREQKGVKVALFVDNEEIGSKTSQGADSFLLKNTLERIIQVLFQDREIFYRVVNNSFVISADLGHAIHYNFSEKNDITNYNFMGKGICVKYSSNQRYATNSFSSAVLFNLCEKANIKYQKFVNNSNIVGGTTIGPIISSSLNIPTVDVGCPILAMHSIREIASVKDNFECFKLFCEFYKNSYL